MQPLGCATCLGSVLLFGIGTKLLRQLALYIINQAKETNPGIPLTRANADHLPVPDNLGRASSEPMQAQEAVLLRAAAEGMERHEEQLVRAAVTREEP